MKLKNLTSKEFEIMKIFWQNENPLTANQIVTLSVDKTWSLNSLYPLLNKLLKQDFIEVVGNIRSTKAPTRIFAVKISALDYTNMQLQSIFINKNKSFNLEMMLSYFCNHSHNSEDVKKEISEWVEKHI